MMNLWAGGPAPIEEGPMRALLLVCTVTMGSAAIWLGAPPPVSAEEPKPYRVRGTLEAVEGDKLTVETREGETLGLTLQDQTRVMVVKPASLDDIKQGDYVGLTSIESGGKRVAISAHIFGEDLRGTAEGHVPWDLVKEPNTMTNATVAEVQEVGDQRELEVTYRQGEGEAKSEGSQTIYVPEELSVVRMEKAADRSVLKPGEQAFLVVRDAADTGPTALAVIVGSEGAAPPM
jgi:hypothetical protein